MATTGVERPGLEERPLGELVANLTRDISLLLRQELELFKRESGEKVRALWNAASSTALGGVLCHVGVLAVTAGVILLLAEVVAVWLSALVVGAVYCAVGASLLRRGTTRLQAVRLEPEAATESLRRDVDAIKEAMQ